MCYFTGSHLINPTQLLSDIHRFISHELRQWLTGKWKNGLYPTKHRIDGNWHLSPSSTSHMRHLKHVLLPRWQFAAFICCISFQVACCFGSAACTLCCSACPSCNNSVVTRIAYALLLLVGVAVSCIMLAPGLADQLAKVNIRDSCSKTNLITSLVSQFNRIESACLQLGLCGEGTGLGFAQGFIGCIFVLGSR